MSTGAADLVALVAGREALARFVVRKSGVSIEDAREAVQEALARAATRRDAIRQVFPWTATAALRVALDWRKHQQVRRETLAELRAEPERRTPECHVAGAQELAIVARLLDELPPRCRRVVLWRRVHGLTARQIEKRHGIPARTVRGYMVDFERFLREREVVL